MKVPIVSDADCNAAYSEENYAVYPSMLCAGALDTGITHLIESKVLNIDNNVMPLQVVLTLAKVILAVHSSLELELMLFNMVSSPGALVAL